MNVRELQKLLKNFTEENVVFDEPHMTQRCKENNLTNEKITYPLLHETGRLSHMAEDRPKVYKVYFTLSKRRQLKLIIDFFKQEK